MMKNTKLKTISEETIKETILQYLVYWKWFVLGVFICLSVAFTYIRYSKNIYQTSAKIKVLDNTQGGIELPSDINSLLSNKKVNLDNEIGVLKSQRLLKRVVLALNLTTTYYFDGKIKSSELWGNSPFKVIWLNSQDTIQPKKIKFSIEFEKGGYKIISDDKLSNQGFKFGQKYKVLAQSFILVLAVNAVPEKRKKEQFTINRIPLSFVVED